MHSNPLPRPGAQPQRRRGAAGFTLVEVLVSIVVLSFGVLGVVGLQAAALQANKEARFQSSAARLGRELADLMRGNNSVSTLSGSSNPYLIDFPTNGASTTVDCYATASCTAATVAGATQIGLFQMRDWLARVGAELPGARVVVCLDATSTGASSWTCSNSGSVVVAKMGWNRQSTNRAASGNDGVDLASASTAPSIVIPLVTGNP